MVWLCRTVQEQECHAVFRTQNLVWDWWRRGSTGRMSQNPLLLWGLVVHYCAGDLKSVQYSLFRPPHMRLAHWNWTQADQEKTFFKSTQGTVLRSGNVSDSNNTRQSPKASAAPFDLWIPPLYPRQAPRASWRTEAWAVSTSRSPWMPLRAAQAAHMTWHAAAAPRVAERVFFGTFVMPFHCTGQDFNRERSKFTSPLLTQRTINSRQHR